MRRTRSTCLIIFLLAILFSDSGCKSGREYSTTYNSHFFGLYKPKAKKASTPQRAYFTGFRGVHDPFSRHGRKRSFRVDGDGYHSVVRRKRANVSSGAKASARGTKGNKFFQRKTRRRRSPAQEDKKIFGKYQHKKKHG
jgi:hypothetical protein